MINKAVLIGRLTRSIEIRKTPSGTSVCDFTLAVNRNKQVEGQPDADFIGCIAWNKTADLMFQYLHKGSLIAVEGRIQTSSYDNKKGERVYKTHVVVENIQFLEPKSNDKYANDEDITMQAEKESSDISNEDLPF